MHRNISMAFDGAVLPAFRQQCRQPRRRGSGSRRAFFTSYMILASFTNQLKHEICFLLLYFMVRIEAAGQGDLLVGPYPGHFLSRATCITCTGRTIRGISFASGVYIAVACSYFCVHTISAVAQTRPPRRPLLFTKRYYRIHFVVLECTWVMVARRGHVACVLGSTHGVHGRSSCWLSPVIATRAAEMAKALATMPGPSPHTLPRTGSGIRSNRPPSRCHRVLAAHEIHTLFRGLHVLQHRKPGETARVARVEHTAERSTARGGTVLTAQRCGFAGSHLCSGSNAVGGGRAVKRAHARVRRP
jgi:hypothetical protein